MPSALALAASIERALGRGVDPFFGAPLSPAEWALWEHVREGLRRRRRTWREWLGRLAKPLEARGGFDSFGLAAAAGRTGKDGGAEARLEAGHWVNGLPWLFPASDFISFDKYGTVALPAIAALAAIGGTVANGVITLNAASNMPWIVNRGQNGFLKTLAVDFVANGSADVWVQGVLPPQLQFALLIQGQPDPDGDYKAFFYSPGTVAAPTPIAGVPVKEQQLVQLQVTNLAVTVDGVHPQYVEARLQGYYYGKQLEPTKLAH